MKKLKILNIVTLIIFVFVVLSCNQHRTDGNIVGAWMSIEDNNSGEISWMNGKTIYTFNIDGTFIKDNHVWIGNKDYPRLSSGVWQRNGNTLLLKETKSTDKSLLDEERIIIELTEKYLKMRPTNETDLEWSYKRVK